MGVSQRLARVMLRSVSYGTRILAAGRGALLSGHERDELSQYYTIRPRQDPGRHSDPRENGLKPVIAWMGSIAPTPRGADRAHPFADFSALGVAAGSCRDTMTSSASAPLQPHPAPQPSRLVDGPPLRGQIAGTLIDIVLANTWVTAATVLFLPASTFHRGSCWLPGC